MKKLSLLPVIFIVLIVLIFVSGCGSSGNVPRPDSQDASSSAGVAETAAEPTPTPTEAPLAPPTPRVAPPTPTLVPDAATPTPAAADETKAEATPTEAAAGPSATDIMIEIPAGPFNMGSNRSDLAAAPAHDVDLSAYEIDKFEVTNADYAAFTAATGYVTYNEEQELRAWHAEWTPGENDNHPVVRVTWNDATAYCEWLGKRLPTEAEWEKAARGDDRREFPWGNDWDPEKANVKAFGLRGTAAVGSFGAGASPYGVEDMTGNVWEWTADWYQGYPASTANDPYFGEEFRVTRGGGWFEEEAQSTTHNRNAAAPDKTANDDLGFRCAR